MTNPMLAELDEVVRLIDIRRTEGRLRYSYAPDDFAPAVARFFAHHAPALADMAKRLEALQSLAAAMYQAAGAYDMPARFLDVLSAAGNGKPITEEQVDGLLPCETPDTLQRLEAAERDAGKCWALHFKGPDDVVAAPSKQAAELAAKNFNAIWDAHQGERGHDVRVVAAVIEWDHGYVEHAKCVIKHWPEYADLLDAATREGEG